MPSFLRQSPFRYHLHNTFMIIFPLTSRESIQMESSASEASLSKQHIFLECPTVEDLDMYYKEIQSDQYIQVLNDTNHPIQPYKGLFATRKFEKGEEVFREEPLVCMQSIVSAQSMLNCQECLGYIGSSILAQLYHFLGHHRKRVDNVDVEKDTQKVDGMVDCVGGCEHMRYCSNPCRDASWNAHHCLMCPGASENGREWWEAFYEHAYNTNDVFILAGRAMSMVILDASHSINKHGLPPQEALVRAWKPFQMGFKKKWWHSVALPNDVDPADEDQFRAELKELANDSLTLYSHAVEIGHPHVYEKCKDFIHIDIWGSIIGMFELNNLSIVGRGPYSVFSCDDDQIKDILKSDDFVEEFTDSILEGTGFYRLHSCMNHSCEPNCRAILPRQNSENNKAIIQAIQPIYPGTELTVSYIEEDEPYQARQESLRDYGFTCTCSKCQRER